LFRINLLMKLTVLKENLNRGLSIALKAVANRPQLPVLAHILFKTDQGRLKISSTDLETGINLWIGAKISREGSISIPAKILTEFVSSLPAGKIDLEAKDNTLELMTESSRASFNGLAATEFPKIPSVQGQPALTIEPADFTKAISQVAFAAASDETRPVLTGIYFIFKDSKLSLVATDGYRLSLKNFPKTFKLSPEHDLSKGLIVPARTLQEAARITAEENKEIKFYLSADSNQLIFQTGDVEIITRLIEGKYPEFEKIIPAEGKIKTVIDTDEFTRIIKIAAIFARDSANIVRFKLDKEGIEVSANTAQIGENKSVVKTKVEGGEEKIAFNSRYLLDFLSIVGSETFQLTISDSLSPGVFRSEKDETFLHIIMPVRVQE